MFDINSTTSESHISQLLNSRIDSGDFPSAVYLIAERGQIVFADALGDAVRAPQRHPATLETIYDLASLTKPLVTGLLMARLFEQGKVSLDENVARYLSEFDRADKHRIVIRQLLTHTSGLPAWRPLYLLAENKVDTLAAIAKEQLQIEPGERVIYSDSGFIVLGFLIEKLSASSLAELAQRELFAPLKLNHAFFNPAEAARTGIAACESGNAYERDMCERDFASLAPKNDTHAGWREDVIWGQVHDGNAYFLGGSAGHAGLFANVTDTLRLANQFIGSQSELLSAETCELFRHNMTDGLNEARSFAWQLAATPDSTGGPALPNNAFGHTGFTGTSCWIDSEAERIFILLTNRTHARALPFANINQVRREFHSLAVAALESSQHL